MAAHSPSTPSIQPFVQPRGTLLLSSSQVRAALPLRDCIGAVERGFALHARGMGLAQGVLGAHVPGGGFHVKAAGLPLDRPYFAAKTNANFPGNARAFGLPTIQGAVMLCDAENGFPLAIMDSMEITALRTAAATAVAVRHLARPDAATLALAGCGRQAADQLAAVAEVRRVQRVFVADIDPARARRFAAEQSRGSSLCVEAMDDFPAAARTADIVVTCTTAKTPLLGPGDVSSGAMVAAVGADNPEKNEIAPGLMAAAAVVCDSLDQCAEIGDLRHAVAQGAMRREDARAELGAVVAGKAPGRVSPDEIVVFDSTGTAIQDVAAAALAYRNALAADLGTLFDFAA
jgi:ornithine cyclodeaminase/alanine dehydrogenase-like protein (mu-crystallin family)